MGWRPLARPGSVIREECSRAVSQGRAAGAAPTRPSKPPNCLQLLAWLSCQGPAWARGLHAGGRPAPSSGNGALQKARVNGPRSGPPWPAQVQPFPGQAALGRAETLWQAGGGQPVCETLLRGLCAGHTGRALGGQGHSKYPSPTPPPAPKGAWSRVGLETREVVTGLGAGVRLTWIETQICRCFFPTVRPWVGQSFCL